MTFVATRRLLSSTVLAFVLFGVLPSAAIDDPAGGRSILIFTAEEGDPRVAATLRAVTFWNEAFANLNLRPRLVEPEVIVGSPLTRSFENYARFISQRGGRMARAGVEPKAPPELAGFGHDIIVFLSQQSISSFSWPIAHTSRYFVAIRTDQFPPMNDPNASHNVIAHEIGHTLGLTHNRNPTTLMCGPCRPLSSKWEAGVFLRLTDQDRARLVELHSAN